MRSKSEICVSHSTLSSYIDYSMADDIYFKYWGNSELANEKHYNNFINEKLGDFLQKFFKVQITEIDGKIVTPRDDFKMRFGNWFEERVIFEKQTNELRFDDYDVIISPNIFESVKDVIDDCATMEYQKEITTPDFQNFKGFVDFFLPDMIVDIKTTFNFNKDNYINSVQVPLYQRICGAKSGCYVVFVAKQDKKKKTIDINDVNRLYTDIMPEWKYRELQVIAAAMIENYDTFKKILETRCKFIDNN